MAADVDFGEIIGQSAALKRVLEEARIIAPSDSSVLILGETGTGKEVIARAVHRMSSRKDLSFVKMNCAAIPNGLLESELFGHEKGAFTGAVNQKIGRLELADKGTLLLDEVGTFLWTCSRSFSACCRMGSSRGWAAPARFRSTYACSPLRIGT